MECKYWDFIENNLPNYYSSDLVLTSDILFRYVTNDDMEDSDIWWIEKEYKTKENVINELKRIDLILFSEALNAYYDQIE